MYVNIILFTAHVDIGSEIHMPRGILKRKNMRMVVYTFPNVNRMLK